MGVFLHIFDIHVPIIIYIFTLSLLSVYHDEKNIFFLYLYPYPQLQVYTVYMEFHSPCYTWHMGLIRELFIFVYDMIFVNMTVTVVTFPK